MAVSEPLVLLLIDYVMNKKPDRKNLLEKIPFFTVAAVCAALSYVTQENTGAISQYPSLILKMCVPFYGMLFYLVKTIVPIQLSAFYPFPIHPDSSIQAQILLSPLLVIGIGTAVYYSRRYSKKAVFGALFFLVTIAPVLQIVPIGKFIVAERYTYIPLIGVYFVFAEGLAYVYNNRFKNNGIAKKVLTAGLCLLLFIYGCETYRRCGVWKDSLTLWNDVIAQFPVAFAYNHRGVAYHVKGDYDRAILDYTQAIALDPNYAVAYTNRGLAYTSNGNGKHAIMDYTQAITLDPRYAQAYTNRGVAYHAVGDYDRAISDYTQAIVLNPRYVKAYIDRGLAYHAKGDDGRALEDVEKACGLGFSPACKLIGK